VAHNSPVLVNDFSLNPQVLRASFPGKVESPSPEEIFACKFWYSIPILEFLDVNLMIDP